MSADEHLNPVQFQYSQTENRSGYVHHITAKADEGTVGEMHWSDARKGQISHIWVDPDRHRQGIATGMWNTGHEIAKSNGITPPKHSPDRSDKGDAWARAVSGRRLPRRVSYE